MIHEILIVDCQYDFIDGTLACGHSQDAVKNIVDFINSHPDAKVYYSSDWHSINHCSYSQNGGTWPVHCQAGTHGAEIHESFYHDVKNIMQRPNEKNIYYKGDNDSQEEYSAFSARNKAGHELNEDIGKNITVTGIASEFCVRESVIEFLKAGRNIEVYENLLGWVDENNHRKNIHDLANMGVKIS